MCEQGKPDRIHYWEFVYLGKWATIATLCLPLYLIGAVVAIVRVYCPFYRWRHGL